MKNRAKNRRHQTAYEAPEVEGEFLNDSADTMLSVSDSLGNLTSTTVNEIDSTLLEEFNEDQESVRARPVETPTQATKRVGASRSTRESVQTRKKLDREEFAAPNALSSAASTVQDVKDKAMQAAQKAKDWAGPLANQLSTQFQSLSQNARTQGNRSNEVVKAKPYLFVLGAVVAGFAFAKIVTPSTNHRR